MTYVDLTPINQRFTLSAAPPQTVHHDLSDDLPIRADLKNKLKQQSDQAKRLQQSIRNGSGQGQADTLKRQMLRDRLRLLLQQVALMNKQSAKAAMVEVQRIAGELREMSAQPATTPVNDGTATPGEKQDVSVTASSTQEPAEPTNAPAPTQTATAPSSLTQSTDIKAPNPKEDAGKIQASDAMAELKQLLKRVLHALEKRLENAPDDQASSTTTGRFIDVQV